MTGAASSAVQPHRLGVWSLCIALGTLAVVLPVAALDIGPVVVTYLDLDAGRTGGATIRWLSAVLVKVAVVLHGLGAGLGFAALFRRGDSRGLGFLGLFLNGGALAVCLMFLGFTGAVE